MTEPRRPRCRRFAARALALPLALPLALSLLPLAAHAAPAGSPVQSFRDMPVVPVAQAARLATDVGQGRPVVLHFWATWCPACEQELPRLRSTLLGLSRQGVAVLLVSIDKPEDRARALRELRRKHLSRLPSVLLDAPEPDPVAASVGEPSWDGSLPATFVFDGRGKRMRSFIGPVQPKALQEAVRAVLAPNGSAGTGAPAAKQ